LHPQAENTPLGWEPLQSYLGKAEHIGVGFWGSALRQPETSTEEPPRVVPATPPLTELLISS